MPELQTMINELKQLIALQRKMAIHPPLKVFENLWDFGSTIDPIGDDAAILTSGDEYLLFSCDGILPQLVKEEPYWAGYCAVLVSVSDIYAMGGRPMAMVNLLSAPNQEISVSIAKGMAEGCKKLGVPMVGGHFFPEEASGVATAIIGKASHLLRATQGKPGQSLIIALDLNGKQFKHYLQWNSTSLLEPKKLQNKLEVLPRLAEAGLAKSARDISNAGILGTLAMLAENSGCGAEINLDKLPKPFSIDMKTWLTMYPGYGFILSVDESDEKEVIKWFKEEGISAKTIGKFTEELSIVIKSKEEKALYLDLSRDRLVVNQNV